MAAARVRPPPVATWLARPLPSLPRLPLSPPYLGRCSDATAPHRTACSPLAPRVRPPSDAPGAASLLSSPRSLAVFTFPAAAGRRRLLLLPVCFLKLRLHWCFPSAAPIFQSSAWPGWEAVWSVMRLALLLSSGVPGTDLSGLLSSDSASDGPAVPHLFFYGLCDFPRAAHPSHELALCRERSRAVLTLSSFWVLQIRQSSMLICR
ncbi:unnamed protein product [Urochloa humidicola]